MYIIKLENDLKKVIPMYSLRKFSDLSEKISDLSEKFFQICLKTFSNLSGKIFRFVQENFQCLG